MTEIQNNGGYSLIELLVAVALVALLMGIALPSFSHMVQSAKFRDEARGIASILRLARSESARHNLEYQVKFEVANNRYKIQAGNKSNGSNVWSDAAGGWVNFADGVTMAALSTCSDFSTNRNFHFNPNGSANKLYICVMDGVTKKFKVGVGHATTGRVEID